MLDFRVVICEDAVPDLLLLSMVSQGFQLQNSLDDEASSLNRDFFAGSIINVNWLVLILIFFQ